MAKIVVGVALRDRLGEDGARALSEYVEQQAELWRADVVSSCTERIDTRLQTYAGKGEVLEGFNEVIDRLAETKIELADRMSAMRVELLRWSFAFWLGQIAAMTGLMALMFQLFGA